MITLEIQQALLNKLAGLPEVKVVEIFEGQGGREKAGAVKTSPAAYLELKSQVHRQLGRKGQLLKLTLEVTILTKTEADATEQVQGKGLSHYQASDAVFKTLEGKRLRKSDIPNSGIEAGSGADKEICGSMARSGFQEDLKGQFMKTVHAFTFTARDLATHVPYGKATPKVTVTAAVASFLTEL